MPCQVGSKNFVIYGIDKTNFFIRRTRMKKDFLLVFLMVFSVIGFASAIDIKDSNNRIVGRLDGNTVKDASNRIIGRIDGSTIKDASNRIIGRIDGDTIKDAGNRIIGRVTGTPTQVKMAALLSFFFFYLI
jgi:outer membrane lipoprotein SlyB